MWTVTSAMWATTASDPALSHLVMYASGLQHRISANLQVSIAQHKSLFDSHT